MNDDAEFEAFLKGEGDLARALQGVPQPSPPAALDAAILGRIRTSIEQQQGAAANDPGEAVPAPRLARGLGMRWKVPAGIAASALVGLIATHAYQSGISGDLVSAPAQERAADAVMKQEASVVGAPAAADPAPVAEAVPAPAPAAKPAASPKPMGGAQSRPVPLPVPAPAPAIQDAAENRSFAPPPPAPAPAAAAPPPAIEVISGQDQAGGRLARAAAAQKAKTGAAREAGEAEKKAVMERVEISASRLPPRQVAEGASPVQVLQRETVTVTGSSIKRETGPVAALAWVRRIEALLAEGDEAQAKWEWVRFREQYPRHKVDDALEQKMKVLME